MHHLHCGAALNETSPGQASRVRLWARESRGIACMVPLAVIQDMECKCSRGPLPSTCELERLYADLVTRIA